MSKEIKQGISKNKNNKNAPTFLSNSTSGTLLEQEEKYAYMKQNSVTNAFSRITSNAGFAIDEKHNKGTLVTVNGGTTLTTTIKNFKEITLSQSTSRLFRILAIEYTRTKKDKIVIPLQRYMEIIDNDNMKLVKRLVTEDLRALKNVVIEYETASKVAGMPNDAGGMDIITDWEVYDKTIFVTLHPNIAAYLKISPILACPMSLLRLKSYANNNPYAQCIGDKFMELLKLNMYNFNKEQNKEYAVISVEKMLEVCTSSGLPSFEELRTKNRLQALLKKMPPEIINGINAGVIPDELYKEISPKLEHRADAIIKSLIVTKVVNNIPVSSIVKTNFRDLNKLIVEPFDKDLEYCCENTDFFECEYINNDGTPLTKEQLEKPKFAEFIQRNIKVYPKQDYKRANFDALKFDAAHKSQEREEKGITKKSKKK